MHSVDAGWILQARNSRNKHRRRRRKREVISANGRYKLADSTVIALRNSIAQAV